MRIRTTSILVLCLGIAACAAGNGTGNDSATSNGPVGAPSGVSSNNGGGQRQLGNMPSVGIVNGPAGGTGVIGDVPNGRGNSY